MFRRWSIRTLLLLMLFASCLLSMDLYVNRSTSSFQKDIKTDWPNYHTKLMHDAGVDKTRTVLSFLDPIPLATVQVESPTIADRLLFRRQCRVCFQTHYKGTDGLAVLNHTSQYTVGLFGSKFNTTQEDLSWAQLK